jgi:hypothetical protein
LTDVAPDGSSAQVAIGALNLTHRESHTAPEPLEPGRRHEVRVPLRASGYRFLPGHRIRLSVASGYWPVLWPSPYPCQIGIHHGPSAASRLILPVVPPAGEAGDVPPPEFKASPADVEEVGAATDEPPTWDIVDDVIAGTVAVRLREAGRTTLPDGRTLFSSEQLTMIAADRDPAVATLETTVIYRWQERDFETEIVAEGTIASDAGAFTIDLELAVTLDGEDFFDRRWHERVPRRLV